MEFGPDQNQTPPATIQPKLDQKPSILKRGITLKPVTLLIIGLSALIFGFLLIFLFIGSEKNDGSNENQVSNSDNAVEKEQQRLKDASAAAQVKSNPINQLQTLYDDVIGGNKRTLTIDGSGTALIEYEIASTDGQTIIKTSYENFADLSQRTFNINSIKRLTVISFANKFIDKFGQPNIFALKLSISKETNDKINWSVKKYSYVDYVTLLDSHEINPDLTKDYKTLTKQK